MVIGVDFNGLLVKGTEVMGSFGIKERNLVVDFKKKKKKNRNSCGKYLLPKMGRTQGDV